MGSYSFLFAVTLVAADYGFTCPPRFMSVVVVVVGVGKTDGNCNFSAVRSPIELKLGGDLVLVSQISVHVLVSIFDYFLYCKQTKERKNRENRENRGFTKLAFSPLFQVRLI
jgi:translation initiation factor IF-3